MGNIIKDTIVKCKVNSIMKNYEENNIPKKELKLN